MATIDIISSAAAIAATSLFTGNVPTPARYAALVDFAKTQFQSYTAMGVGNPSLGPFEALGKAFAADASTKGAFATYFGGGTNSTFVDSAYGYVYGAAPTAGAHASLVSQVDYFTALYKGAGIGAADAQLQARGAVLGQIVGYAFTDSAAASRTVIDDVVNALAAKAAAGDFSSFGKDLPGFDFPTPLPTVKVVVPTSTIQDFTLDKAVAEIFVVNPQYYGNQITGFVVGQDKLDLSGVAFGPGVVRDALTQSGPDGKFFIAGGVQHAAVINSGALFIDVDGNGDFKGAVDIMVQLVGTQGNPTSADLIFA